MDPFGIMSSLSDWVDEWLLNVILGMASFTWQMLSSAFVTEQISEDTWNVVSNLDQGTGFIYSWIWVMAPILVAVVAVQAVWSAFRRSKAGIIRAGVGAAVGIPLSLVAVWLVQEISGAMDEATIFFAEQMGSSPVQAFMKALGFIPGPEGAEAGDFEKFEAHWIWLSFGEGAALVAAAFMVILAAIAALILNIMMVFRGFALVVAAALAPVVIMMLPLEVSKSWFTRWAELVTGLLIAKPLAFSVLLFSMSLFDASSDVAGTSMALIGMVVASFMPLLVMKFISFTPASSTSDMDQGAKGAAQSPARVASSVIRSRSFVRRK